MEFVLVFSEEQGALFAREERGLTIKFVMRFSPVVFCVQNIQDEPIG